MEKVIYSNILNVLWFLYLVRNQDVACAVCLKQYLPPNSLKTYEFGLFIDMPIIKFPKSNIEYSRYVYNTFLIIFEDIISTDYKT